MPPGAAVSQKVIDAHIHIMNWNLAKPAILESIRTHQKNFAEIASYVKDPKRLVSRLDDEGIDSACLINYVAPEVMGFPPSVNEWVHEYTKDYRDRLVPFGGIHPLHVKNARVEVETLVNKYEFGGIKVHPVHSLYRCNDYEAGEGALRTLYEICERERVPVMVHTGTSIFPGARNKYGDPMDIDDVAIDYPKLKIVMAHFGRPLWMETANFLVRRHPNVMFDLSGIPPGKLLEYVPSLERLSEKAIFGSDWPGPMVPGMRENADEVAKLPLSSEAKSRILYGNAANLYK